MATAMKSTPVPVPGGWGFTPRISYFSPSLAREGVGGRVPFLDDDLVQARLKKLDAIRELGIDPFPRRYDRTHLSNEILADFDRLEGTPVRVAGRLVGAIRHMGKAGFAHIQDNAGRIQIHFRKDTLGDD